MSDTADVIDQVRRALGRTAPLPAPPIPPAIEEPITRLVSSDLGLPALFASRAAANKIAVQTVTPETISPRLIEFLHGQGVRKLVLSVSALIEKLGIARALREAGFSVAHGDQTTLDELYDADAGITDVYAAVAETGSLVIRASPAHARSLSLVPSVHVAIVQGADLLPDLLDLFEKLTREGVGSNTVIISGPSKTSDIEMTLITGVHGPQVVHVFLLH